MAFRNRIVILGLMLAMLAIAQGCSSKPEMAERNVIVTLDDSLSRATAVQVDLLGANETELARLTSWPVDEYWRDASMNKVPSDRKTRSEEHTSELQSPCNLVCRLLLEKKKNR